MSFGRIGSGLSGNSHLYGVTAVTAVTAVTDTCFCFLGGGGEGAQSGREGAYLPRDQSRVAQRWYEYHPMCVRIRGHLSVCARGCVRSCCVFCAVVRHLRVSWFCPSAPYNACVACSKEGVVRPRASQLRVRHDEGGGGDRDGVPDHLGLRARPSREKRPRHWVETRRERVDYPMLLRDEGEEDGERDAGGERGREVDRASRLTLERC